MSVRGDFATSILSS